MTSLTPVYVNVYDLTEYNKYLYWIGLGFYHSGLEVHGVEYAFGAHDHPSSGVFELEPRNTPGFQYRKTIFMGNTSLSHDELRSFIEDVSTEYYGDTYHLIVKNCNHFTNDLTMRLVGKEIPGFINRMARIGLCINCVLPEYLKVDSVKSPTDYQQLEDEDSFDEENAYMFSTPSSVSNSNAKDSLKIKLTK